MESHKMDLVCAYDGISTLPLCKKVIPFPRQAGRKGNADRCFGLSKLPFPRQARVKRQSRVLPRRPPGLSGRALEYTPFPSNKKVSE